MSGLLIKVLWYPLKNEEEGKEGKKGKVVEKHVGQSKVSLRDLAHAGN